jgi:hypothetical protein
MIRVKDVKIVKLIGAVDSAPIATNILISFTNGETLYLVFRTNTSILEVLSEIVTFTSRIVDIISNRSSLRNKE